MIAYHFVGKTLHDGSPIPADGEWLEIDGKPIMCEQGFHASRCPFDALRYAPGDTLCLVELGGTIIAGDDKLVAARRKIIKRVDLTATLRHFARMQALSVVHLWDAPQLVLDFLMTGDESLRDAARDAARAATWAATWATARAAARAAAWEASREAARATAWEAAKEAAWAAAWATAWDAAWAAAWATAWDAAWDAAWAAARKDFRQLVDEAFGQMLTLVAALCSAVLMDVHVGSYHTANDAGYTNANYGLGGTCVRDGYSLSAGVYRNSFSNTSAYATVNIETPGVVRFGASLGAATGYSTPVKVIGGLSVATDFLGVTGRVLVGPTLEKRGAVFHFVISKEIK